MTMPTARDREASSAVEGGASGAAATLDGNYTNSLYSWIFPNENWGDGSSWPQMADELMWFTANGHLAWVVFPPVGFRL